MADITVTELATTDTNGTDITGAGTAAASLDEFVNDGKTLLLIRSTATGTPTVTVTAQRSLVAPDGVHIPATNHAVTLSAGNTTTQYHILGPFPPAMFNDGDGRCQITYSAVTDLTVRVLRLKSN